MVRRRRSERRHRRGAGGGDGCDLDQLGAQRVSTTTGSATAHDPYLRRAARARRRSGTRTMIRRFSLPALALVALLSATAANPAPLSYEQRLVDLEQRYIAWSFQQNPTYATDS